jgi:hypothetical protein
MRHRNGSARPSTCRFAVAKRKLRMTNLVVLHENILMQHSNNPHPELARAVRLSKDAPR